MRRIYYTDPKRKKLCQDALLELRRTRRLIDPDLLDHIRSIIDQRIENAKSFQDNQSPEQKIPVDYKKNLLTVRKFLELKPDDKVLQKQVQDLILQGLE